MAGATTVLSLAVAASWFGIGAIGPIGPVTGPGQRERAAAPPSIDAVTRPLAGTEDASGGAPGGAADSAQDNAPGGQETDRIPGLGPATLAAIPAASGQVLMASGTAKDSSDSTVTLWTRASDGRWRPGTAWPAHNALRGWTGTHSSGDLHSPVGVFTLSDAGGFKPDPGSGLPYHRSQGFTAGGIGFRGEALGGSFDYVIAIDYNRVPGTSPLDGRQPLGARRGGGIWIHVDHGGPTHGCVSLSARHMVDLLRALDPRAHPVIAMGDGAALAL
ncbi:L,D-transpeptidase family protein [Streptomyces sp. H10-C2]|uniref:L,D-transpeptidase family protein n=1 Tax=unclassified Streptomyces TaxID=2593676 RepID=UPI0024BA8525|nr:MULTISPECIES: L,D-transpeptidase family protein [unclassified Streptomyces]MDJ0341856.1 L,D-transpeptidase family protein [Streptomyces sp. PH10-H1]MDJ0370390.1 L,D-transpeptidase family protein [Streptomyces sp. H10-C2]